jgi:putative proteasome-type protease
MTYCLALRLDDGLVLLSDTRTNAGVDNISTFRKLHVLRPREDRLFVIQAAGSLATTHEVLDRIDRDLRREVPESLATVDHLFEAALYVARLAREVATSHAPALGRDANATFLVSGQIAGERPNILLVYSEGNYIRASDTRPFLQIGESKYGKFMLELAVEAHVALEPAAKIALASMLMTAHANLSVGPPYDLAIYRNGSLELTELRIEEDSPYLAELNARWNTHLMAGLQDLPPTPDGVELP